MSGATPGPWRVQHYSNPEFDHESRPGIWQGLRSETGHQQPIVYWGEGDDVEDSGGVHGATQAEALANAALIASAPTLLAERDELRALVERLARRDEYHALREAAQAWLDKHPKT